MEAVQAFKAGADVLLWPPLEACDEIVKQLESGEIPMSRLDDALSRIAKLRDYIENNKDKRIEPDKEFITKTGISVLEGAGLEVVDIVVDGLACYQEVRDDKIDKKDGAIINLGHATTTISIFENGKLVNNETLQIGGINVEKDLSYVFGISVLDGRMLKEKFASSHKRFCQLNEIYEIKNTIGETIKLNQLEVSGVVMSRMVEILNLAKKQIRLLTNNEINYIILTGGLTEIKSFKNLAYEIFGKDVIIYTMTTLGCRDNKYINSIGMIKYFIDKMESRGRLVSMFDIVEETTLTTPNNKAKKDNTKENVIVNKIFGNFIANKEEK